MAKNKEDNENQSDGNSGNGDDSSDNFGLPEIEYKPIERDQPPVRETPIESTSESGSGTSGKEGSDYYDDEEPRSRAPLFIGLIIAVVILVAGFLTYKYWYVPRGIKAKEELAKKEAEAKRLENEARLAKEREEAERKRQDSIAAANAKPVDGTIETLSERTRRFFVIVSSNVDDDLLMDYAKKLSKKGVSTKIIPPYGTTKFYRLAIADFDSFNAAQDNANSSKGEYGTGTWVMRY